MNQGGAHLSETGHMVGEMIGRLLSQTLDDGMMRSARAGLWPDGAWRAAIGQGLHLALVEGEQGFGLPRAEGLEIIRLLGRHAAPLPLAETMMANAFLAEAGLPVVDGVVALVPESSGVRLSRNGSGWHASGDAARIAWGRQASALLIEADGRIALMKSGFRTLAEGTNLAGMPRDRIVVDGPVVAARWPGLPLLEAGALIRAVAMAGALQSLLTITISHVTERRQFGRPLAAFQAVQHGLARLAGEAAAATAAADLAAEAYVGNSPGAGTAIAAARARIGEAAGTASGIAHQLHGAIGFTEEHRLHWFTTALWSWRDEYGSAAFWTRRLGAEALGRPASSYWPSATAI